MVLTGCSLSSLCIPSELQLRRQLSFSEDSDLSSDDILERASQKSKREVCRPSQQWGFRGVKDLDLCPLPSVGFDEVEERKANPKPGTGVS